MQPMITQRESILRAIFEYDKIGAEAFVKSYGFGRATSFLVLHDGREYDPKAIVGVAHGFEHPGGPLKSSDFSGGAPTNSVLERHGFVVVDTRLAERTESLSAMFQEVLDNYQDSRANSYGKTAPMWLCFESMNRILNAWLEPHTHLKLDWSVGKGRWARVPWLAIRDERIAETLKDGCYPVYLFRSDMAGVYLALNQGVGQLREELGGAGANAQLREQAEALRISELETAGFSFDEPEQVGHGSRRDYTPGVVAHRLYRSTHVPDDKRLFLDLHHLIMAYHKLAESSHNNSAAEGWWRSKVTSLNVNHTEGKRAPHKPLTLLTILHHAQEKKREVRFQDTESLLRERIQAVGRSVNWEKPDPREPFWRLQKDLDGVWEVVGPDGTYCYQTQSLPPKLTWLRKATGSLSEDAWTFLTMRPKLTTELMELIADEYFPESELNAQVRRMFDLPTTPLADEPPQPKTDVPLRTIVTHFAEALLDSHITFGADDVHTDFARTFLVSLATKRFVILTGLSGSGKTQIAMRFGDWCGADACVVIPVRPDWTGAEALFGYEDALAEVRDGRRGWAAPQALQFMLRASQNPTQPHLMVLDEMNLAHVERYFADALSGMESGTPVLPNLAPEDDGVWRLRPNQPPRLPIPSNLFIVGTVNVDETTYMFSPKVLDRANTLEFRVTTDALSTELRKPTPCATGPADHVASFLTVARAPEWHHEHDSTLLAPFADHMRALHRVLSEGGFEFGHRVFFEACRYAVLYEAAGGANVDAALDRQVMQKLLPRLHGSRRRLEPTLCALACYCFALSSTGAKDFDPLNRAHKAPRLPLSFNKLQRMTRNLRANQFTSFTE